MVPPQHIQQSRHGFGQDGRGVIRANYREIIVETGGGRPQQFTKEEVDGTGHPVK